MVTNDNICLDDFRPGYPRYSALLSTHDSFLIYRKFTRVRARLLLLKQEELSRMESRLDKIDRDEPCELFLGCNRRDTNEERLEIIKNMEIAIINYDKFLGHSMRTLALPEAKSRDTNSLKNWLSGNRCIAREESEYLTKKYDLGNLVNHRDSTKQKIECILEEISVWTDTKIFMRFHTTAQRLRRRITSDEKIFIFGPWLQDSAQALVTWLMTLVTLVPVIILNSLSTMLGRFVTTVIAIGLFNFTISFMTNARTIEIFASSAAYAAVLVVFTSTNNGLNTG